MDKWTAGGIFFAGMATTYLLQKTKVLGAETFAATTSDGYPTNAPTDYTGSYYTITSNPYGQQHLNNYFTVWKPDGTQHASRVNLRYAKQTVSSAPGYYWKDMTDKQKKKVRARKAKAAKKAAKKYRKKFKFW